VAKPDTENIRGLNLAAARLTVLEMTKLPFSKIDTVFFANHGLIEGLDMVQDEEV
jgi:hypothetical protein